MKFRDKKTGQEVSENIREIADGYCMAHDCFWDKCPMEDAAKGEPCAEWIKAHPIEAVRLMGYEVVEDEKEDSMFYSQSLEVLNPAKAIREAKEKEANMDKPRICEVLGVEPEEKFEIRGNIEDCFRINRFGAFQVETSDNTWCDAPVFCLTNIINRPEIIIRKPRWTQQEVELAKVLYDLRRSESILIGRNKGGALWWRDGDSAEGILPHNLFPSLSECNCVKLDEIIGGAK